MMRVREGTERRESIAAPEASMVTFAIGALKLRRLDRLLDRVGEFPVYKFDKAGMCLFLVVTGTFRLVADCMRCP